MFKSIDSGDSGVIVGNNEIWLGNDIRIISKDSVLSKMYVFSEVLGIPIEQFYSQLKQEKRLKASDVQLKDPRNYIAHIKIDFEKVLTLWPVEVVFKVPESRGRRVVLKGRLSMNEVEKIKEYLQPFIPKLRLGNSMIEQKTGILCSAFSV